jgi:hypothetical protein
LPSKRYNSKRSFGTRFNDIKETFEVVNKQTPPDQIINEGVDFAQLEVNSIDTTTINYGGISASNFSEGAKIASGESNQRVPSELTDVPYWVQVTSGFAELHKQGLHNDENIQNVEATSDGLLFTPTADEASRIYLTGRVPIPKSRKIYSIWESDREVNLRLIWWKNSHPVEVTNTSTTAGVATITTATAHGWTVGNEIRVTGLDVDYNGYHTITAVDTYSISYTSPTLTVSDNLNDDLWETRGSVNLEDYVYEELTNKVEWDADYRLANVSNKVLTSNLATLTTNTSHEFVVGDTLRVSGIDTSFDGTFKVTAVTDTTLSYQKEASDVPTAAVSPAVQVFSLDSDSATEYAVYLEVPAGSPSVLLKLAKVFEVIGYGSKEPAYANVNTSVLTTRVATLTTDAPHSFKIDSSVVISNVGAPYDGTHIISGVPTTNTFTYTIVSGDITSNSSVVGKAVAYNGRQRSELTPDGLRLYQPNGSLAVDLTTATNSVFNIYNGVDVVTSIDSEGKAVFASVDSDNFILGGVALVGDFANASYNGFPYSELNTANTDAGEIETYNSYFNRLPRGTIYNGYFTPETMVMTNASPYMSVASGVFTLEEGRAYRIDPLNGNFSINNSSNKNAVLYLYMGTGPLSIGEELDYSSRFVVGAGIHTSINMPSIHVDATDLDSSAQTIIGKRAESVAAKTGLVATLSTSTANVTLTTGNTANLISGQLLSKTSGTGVFGNSGVVYVGTVFSSTVFNVVDNLGFETSHATSGSITFSAAQSTMISIRTDGASNRFTGDIVGVSGVDYPFSGYWTLRESNDYTDGSSYIKYTTKGIALHTVDLGNVVQRTATLSAGVKTVTVANTAGLYPGFKLDKVSGTGVFGTGTVINSIVSSTQFTTTINHATSGAITFNTTQYQDVDSPVAKTYARFSTNFSEVKAGVPIYWTILLQATPTSTPANANITLSTAGSPYPAATLIVSDEGPSKYPSFDSVQDFYRTEIGSQSYDFDDNTGPHTSGGTTGDGVTVTKTVTKNADQSAYFDNYGRGTSTTSGEYAYRYSLYQGNPGTASGTKKSAIRFPVLDLPTNATVTKVELYLRNRHSYNASGLTVYIGAHSDGNLEDQTTAPLGTNFSGATDTMTAVFAKGQGKWVTLPSDWYSDIGADIVRGVLIGLSAVTSTWYSGLTNYGYFDGVDPTVTTEDLPKLRVTYEYLEGA